MLKKMMCNKLMSESTIYVSVIIPSLNVAKYMEECLESVICQTLKEIEILCIDAGSTDGTLQIIEKYLSRDSRIRLIKSEKKSYGYQVNMGIQEARGRYIGIVEPDDYIEKSMYQSLYSYTGNYFPDFIKGGFTEFASVRNKKVYAEVNRSHLAHVSERLIFFDEAREAGILDLNHIWSGIYRRDFFSEKNIRLNETAGASYQDISFSILVGLLADTGMYVNGNYYFYRVDNENSSVKSSAKWRCVMDEYEYIAQELIKREMYTPEIQKLVCLQKLVSYRWNVLRLSEKGRADFLSEIQPELREFSEGGVLYSDLTDSQKDSVELLRNRSALNEYLDKRQEQSRNLGRLLAGAKRGETFVIVSAGRYGEQMLLLQELSGIKYIKAVADNNIKLQGKTWNGYSVISVSEAVQKHKSDTFIIANKSDSDKIQDQLEKMGVSGDKIYKVSDRVSLEEMLELIRNEIAVIICNYNGGEDTVKCIDAVIKSEDIQCDIYVVDNASTDGSAERIGRQFKETVIVVQNAENLGGSGGFGRGLRMAVEQGYPYIMMLDNDAYVDTDTIKKLYRYLKENPGVGIVGAKIMMSDDPQRIMDYAKIIDFKRFTDTSKWCGQLDSEEACVPRECDFAAATAAMVRREVLLKCGGMDEAHFIYYDDIELGYRIKISGYKVVSLGSAKAWHKSGMTKKTANTFARYYLTRNRYRFFAKYMPKEEIERFTEYILSHAFSYMYGSYYKGRMDIFDTEKYILEDFIRDRRGKAGARRINELQKDGYHLVEEELAGCGRVLVYPQQGLAKEQVVRLCDRLQKMGPVIEVAISEGVNDQEKIDGNKFDKIIHFCRHVKDVQKNILPEIYIDVYGNMIASEQDYIYFRNYENAYAFFRALHYDSVLETIREIRKEGNL